MYCSWILFLPELVSALSGLLDVVMALEPVGVACVAVAAAKAARFCIALRPDRHTDTQTHRQTHTHTHTHTHTYTYTHTKDILESLMTNLAAFFLLLLFYFR